MIQMIPSYSTELFHDIYPTVEDFMGDYGTLGLPKTITDNSANNVYYLLLSRFGNSAIANYDINQFKIKLQAVIWQYGPSWEKRLNIQETLRGLSQQEIASGNVTAWTSSGNNQSSTSDNGSSIKNHAYNPGEITAESTIDHPELKYVDQQNTDKVSGSSTSTGSNSSNSSQTMTKGTLNAYAELWELIDNDVTNDFLNKFRPLFKQFVRPEQHYIYESEV